MVIGSNSAMVRRRVQEVEQVDDVEIVGLVVSPAHDSYQMFVRESSEGEVKMKRPFFLLCDRIAKSFDPSEEFRDLAFTSAQQRITSTSAETTAAAVETTGIEGNDGQRPSASRHLDELRLGRVQGAWSLTHLICPGF